LGRNRLRKGYAKWDEAYNRTKTSVAPDLGRAACPDWVVRTKMRLPWSDAGFMAAAPDGT